MSNKSEVKLYCFLSDGLFNGAATVLFLLNH
jgi:hypothetical protein